MLYSRKLTEHCKPDIMEKNKNHYIYIIYKDMYKRGRERIFERVQKFDLADKDVKMSIRNMYK